FTALFPMFMWHGRAATESFVLSLRDALPISAASRVSTREVRSAAARNTRSYRSVSYPLSANRSPATATARRSSASRATRVPTSGAIVCPQAVRTDCKRPHHLSRSTRATGKPRPAGGAPPGDPSRGAVLLRPIWVRGGHCAAAGGGDRPVAGCDLPPLPGQGVAVPRRRRGR